MMLFKALASLKSPAGRAGCLSTLIFHRVLAKPDPLFPGEPDVQVFDAILGWVGANFNVIPLRQAVDDLAHGSLPVRALAITFDDGYADNYEVALPVLKKHGMSASFFVASGFLDGGRMWNDTVIESIRGFKGDRLDFSDIGLGVLALDDAGKRRLAIDQVLGRLKYRPLAERSDLIDAIATQAGVTLPDDLMMTSAQLRALRDAGMDIGGHTVSHPILARLSEAAAFEEILAGKHRLEAILNEPIELFAYPNGKPGKDYLAAHVAMVEKAGFVAAVSTAPGVARSGCDRYQIARFTPWDRSMWRFNLRLLRNIGTRVELAPDASNVSG